MKQKLLLALLALFTSMGMVKAGDSVTLTLPANSGNLSISVSSGQSFSSLVVTEGGVDVSSEILGTWAGGTSKTFELTNNSSETDWVVRGEYTQITVGKSTSTNNGAVKKIAVSHGELIKLSATYLGISELDLSGASQLKELNVSNNKLKTASGEIEYDFSPLTELTILDCSNNLLSGTLKIGNKVTTLNCSSNQLIDYTGGVSSMRVTFGTQTIIADDAKAADAANSWFDASTLVNGIFSNGTTTFSNFKRYVNNNWISAGIHQKSGTTLYKFQSSTAYESGLYMVTATNNNYSGRTYNIQFKVKPAKFVKSVSTNHASNTYGSIAVIVQKAADNTPAISERTGEKLDDVYVGDILKITATAALNYTLKEFEVNGIKTPLESGSTIEAEVIGLRPSDDIDNNKVIIKAVFNSKSYKLDLLTVAEGGSFSVVDKDGKEITNGSAVAYNSELTIVTTANDTYELDEITINGVLVTTDIVSVSASVKKYTFKMDANKTIAVTYKSKTGGKRSLATTYNKNVCTVEVNGVKVDATTGLDAAIAKNTLVVKVLPVSNSINVANITLNNIPAEKITTDGTNYEAIFTIRAEVTKLSLAVTATALVTPNIVVPEVGSTPDKQTFTYDGTAKPLVYNATPNVTLVVKYTKDGTTTTSAPINAGEYTTTYERSKDNNYAAIASTSGKNIVIQKANLTLTQPNVKVVQKNGVRTYEITGGSATFSGKNVAGSFMPTNEELIVPDDKSGSHIVALTYKPTSTLDKENFNLAVVNASAIEDGKALKQYTIKGTLKDGISVKIMNGGAVLATWTSTNTSGIKVPIDAEIKLVFVVPDDIKLNKVMQNNSSYDDLSLSNNIVTLSGRSENAVIDFILSTASDTKTAYTITVKNKIFTTPYTGSVIQYTTASVDEYYTTGGKSGFSRSYSYKQNGSEVSSPINAGTYDVVVTLTPTTDAGMKQTTANLKMIIDRAPTYVLTKPTASKIGKGQTLASAILTDGNATVEGNFEWLDKSIVPEDGKSYNVIFKPKDSNNYKDCYHMIKEIPGGTYTEGELVSVEVKVSDKAIISLAAEHGTITAKDSKGIVYNSGDEVPVGTVLTFTATPAAGYELLTAIKVNGSAISGTTYTMTAASIAVTADFTQKPFTVTTTASVKGVIITLPASNKVKKGESYVISLAHLATDKPVVKDGSTEITGTNGKYTISNIQSDKSITITLASPTAIEIKADTTLSAHKKPMGTIALAGLKDGKCYYGETVTATATAVNGAKFAGWKGLTATDNPLKLVVTQATTLKALYTGSPVGIEDIEGVQVYGSTGYIFVSCDGVATLTIVGMNGQSTKMEVSGETRIETASGIYGIVLEQGSEIMQKKIVVR